jgi:hypothetical protein
VNCTQQPSGLAVKRRASRCSVVSVLTAGRADRQLDRTGARSSTVPSPAALMIDGLTANHAFLCARVTPVRFEIPARAGSRSSKLIPIKGRRLPNQIAELTAVSGSVRRSGFGVSRAKSVTPKQQLLAILSLLLQNMESALGQFMGDDVVTDHLSPSSLMPFQLALVIAAHLWIAAHRLHGGLRERGFQIVIALLAGPPASADMGSIIK